MERITITINTSNSAFEDAPAAEVARILDELAKHLRDYGLPPGLLSDANGNTCGTVTIEAGDGRQ